jgi:uncharacterized membrane protein
MFFDWLKDTFGFSDEAIWIGIAVVAVIIVIAVIALIFKGYRDELNKK